MKITLKQPNITQCNIRFERGDELYHACMWATINLDHDTFTLTATSDCGDYSYTWCVTEDETFVHLMARINGDYLLSKIASEDTFYFAESMMKTIAEAKQDCPENVEELEGLYDCGEEMFLREVGEITGWEYEYIPVVKEYPRRAETFVKIFTEYVQPLLREKN